MIRCDTCANSKHCNKIVSSDSACYDYTCNLKISVGQTIYFARWEGDLSGIRCKCVSAKVINSTPDFIDVKNKNRDTRFEPDILKFALNHYGLLFFLSKGDFYSVFVDCERD